MSSKLTILLKCFLFWVMFTNIDKADAEDADNKSVYTKTDHITVTKTDPSLLIFGGGNFQMEWAKK